MFIYVTFRGCKKWKLFVLRLRFHYLKKSFALKKDYLKLLGWDGMEMGCPLMLQILGLILFDDNFIRLCLIGVFSILSKIKISVNFRLLVGENLKVIEIVKSLNTILEGELDFEIKRKDFSILASLNTLNQTQ